MTLTYEEHHRQMQALRDDYETRLNRLAENYRTPPVVRVLRQDSLGYVIMQTRELRRTPLGWEVVVA